MGEANEFWNTVRHHWQGADEAQIRPLTESILIQFRNRLPSNENKHLFAALPEEINTISASEARMKAEKKEEARAETLNADEFYQRAGERAGVSSEEARRAGDAVFIAMIEQLPKEEIENVGHMLPPDLEAQWNQAFQSTRSH